MADQWFYVSNGQTKGPIDGEALSRLAREGALERASLIWKEGFADWAQAASVPGLFPPLPPGAPPPPPSAERPKPSRGVLAGIGAKISEVSDLPTVSNVPVRQILMGGLKQETRTEDIEEVFASGTRHTTPTLAEVPSGWPAPRVFWRVLGGALLTYILMRIGITQFGNTNFYPGMIVIGSFVVPFSVVVLFFELNTPRNVSVYQVGKMVMLGGALSLIATMVLSGVITGSGVGGLIPAMLTGVLEETAKALTLLLMVGSTRYRWQTNGLLFGAAVGAGFAGLESAGYAFGVTFSRSLDATFNNIMIRALLAPGGHVIWTAMVGSALWKVRGEKPFEVGMLFHPIVVRRWAIAVVLHGIWDADVYVNDYLKMGALVVVGWYIVFAILKQALSEVEEARQRVAAA